MPYKFSSASVLVVDDMRPMLSLTTSLLKIFGFKNIFSTGNPERAFEIFCKENPDMVITDWQMEPFDGIELVRLIRKDDRSPNPYVPIILMTGYSAKLRVMEARDIGVTEFLVKPFTSKDLYTRIEQLVEKPRQYVDTGDFFGPDRRRRVIRKYDGPFRREEEPDLADSRVSDNDQNIQDLLKKLKDDAAKA
jgi:CheY-like chemotaxis protein